MTLQEYVKEAKRELDQFKEKWKKENKINPMANRNAYGRMRRTRIKLAFFR